jgi:SAM-dependent methyltransferase
VDQDARALAALREAARTSNKPGTEILPVEGDFRNLNAIPALARISLDGVLFANALHFAPDADRVLADAAQLLGPSGRIVVVEYDGRPANRWVPYPVPVNRLRLLAGQARLTSPRVVSERPSAYGGIMYCAVLERSSV